MIPNWVFTISGVSLRLIVKDIHCSHHNVAYLYASSGGSRQNCCRHCYMCKIVWNSCLLCLKSRCWPRYHFFDSTRFLSLHTSPRGLVFDRQFLNKMPFCPKSTWPSCFQVKNSNQKKCKLKHFERNEISTVILETLWNAYYQGTSAQFSAIGARSL